MATPEQIRLALEQKDSKGFPAFTRGQLTDRVIAEDSFLGQKIRRAMEAGVSREQALNFYAYGTSNGKLPEPKKGNFFERLWQDAQKRSANVGSALERQQMGQQGLLSTGLQTAGEAFGLAFGDAPGQAIQSGINATPEAIKQPIAEMGRQALNTPVGQKAVGVLQAGMEKYGDFKQAHPVAAENIESLTNITTSLPVGAIGKAGFEATEQAAKSAFRMVAERQANAALKKVDDAIRNGITKGIKPSTASIQKAGGIDAFHDQADTAIRAIVQRKGQLNITDDFGEEVAERLPQNIRQFDDAIEQTQKNIFKEYDSLKKQAGEAGANLDTRNVANELVEATAKPEFAALEDQHPEIADYILKRASALEKRISYTPEQAQIAVQNYNKSLEAFYRNPSYESFSKASVDAMIANNLRKNLDDIVEGATGGAYRDLKRQYGALKAIKKDVTQRAVIDARKNVKGLIDFADIFTAGDLVVGLARFDPAMLAKGAVQKGIKEYFRFLNDPNQIIRTMFRRVDRRINATPLLDDLPGVMTREQIEQAVRAGQSIPDEQLARFPDLYQEYSGVRPNFTDPASIPDDIPLSQIDNVEASRVDTLNKAGLPEDKLPGGYPSRP